jgi:hypothetical protein
MSDISSGTIGEHPSRPLTLPARRWAAISPVVVSSDGDY